MSVGELAQGVVPCIAVGDFGDGVNSSRPFFDIFNAEKRRNRGTEG